VSARGVDGGLSSGQSPTEAGAEFWDVQAERYDQAYDAPGRGGRALRSRQEAVLGLVGTGPGDVLDAGMGPGRLLGALSDRGWRVSGVDPSDEMVGLARRRIPDAAKRLISAPVEQLPFPDSSFDAVVATGVLEYAGYSPRAYSELARVLCPGALAVVSVPDPGRISRIWRRGIVYPLSRAVKRIAPFGRPAPPWRPPPPGRRQIEEALADAGLQTRSHPPIRVAGQLLYAARKNLAPPVGSGGPELPADYHRRIYEIEEHHWWHRGMRAISGALLQERFHAGGCLVDVGCGTGGFLRWALDEGSFEQVAGADISAEAVELATSRVPEARLRVAPIWDLPFESAQFDLVVLNDVLQHVPDDELARGLREVRRLLSDKGALLLRTNGAWRARREGDWRVFDRATLRSALQQSGFHCERLTYANVAGSLWAMARGGTPRAPSRDRHGIPSLPSPPANACMYRLLRAEAGYLRRSPLGLPYGHALIALATPAEQASAGGSR
jgi:SAM-dependent methyltransferase